MSKASAILGQMQTIVAAFEKLHQPSWRVRHGVATTMLTHIGNSGIYEVGEFGDYSATKAYYDDSDAWDALDCVTEVFNTKDPQDLSTVGARAQQESRLRSRILGILAAGELDSSEAGPGDALADQAEKEADKFQWQSDARPDVTGVVGPATVMNCQASVEYSQRQAWPGAKYKTYGGPDYPELTVASESYKMRSYTLVHAYENLGRPTPFLLRRGSVLVFGNDSRDHVAIYLGRGRVKSLFTHNAGRTYVGPLATILQQDEACFFDPREVMLLTRIFVHSQRLKGG